MGGGVVVVPPSVEKKYKSIGYITLLLRHHMIVSKSVDIIWCLATVGEESPFVVGSRGLHRALAQDTLHIAQEQWP